jgi:hypothetical protein
MQYTLNLKSALLCSLDPRVDLDALWRANQPNLGSKN